MHFEGTLHKWTNYVTGEFTRFCIWKTSPRCRRDYYYIDNLYHGSSALLQNFDLPGWQSRWFVLDGGVLSYYLSAEDVRLGCRGSVRMASCSLKGESQQPLIHSVDQDNASLTSRACYSSHNNSTIVMYKLNHDIVHHVQLAINTK